jgi:hypothetical protein
MMTGKCQYLFSCFLSLSAGTGLGINRSNFYRDLSVILREVSAEMRPRRCSANNFSHTPIFYACWAETYACWAETSYTFVTGDDGHYFTSASGRPIRSDSWISLSSAGMTGKKTGEEVAKEKAESANPDGLPSHTREGEYCRFSRYSDTVWMIFSTVPHTGADPFRITHNSAPSEPAFPRRPVNTAGDLLPMASTMKAAQLTEVLSSSSAINASTINLTSCAISLFRSRQDGMSSSKSTPQVTATLTSSSSSLYLRDS